MIRIVRSKVRAEVPKLSDETVQSLGQRLYTRAEQAAGELTELEDRGIELTVRDGSIDIVTVVMSTVTSVYVALTLYDGFWSALDRVRAHAERIGDALSRDSATEAHNVGGTPLSTKVTYGHLDKLHKIQRALEAGRIDTDSAVTEVVRTLRTADEPVTEDMIREVERALGAKHSGLARLIDSDTLIERRDYERSIHSGVPAEARQPKKRERRFTIRRRPGEVAPRSQFDS